MPTLNAPLGGNSNKQIAPEGTYAARCYQIIDLGTSEQGGNFPGKKRKVQFLFELPTELAVFAEDKGEQPYYVRSIYTLSMNEKALLRRDISAWLGKKITDSEAKSFDVFSLIGAACLVNIVHVTKGENTYVNIMSISPLPKGMVCPPAINPALVYTPSQHDGETFAKLPEFVQEKIKESDEYKIMAKPFDVKVNTTKAPTRSATFEDDINDLDILFGEPTATKPPF